MNANTRARAFPLAAVLLVVGCEEKKESSPATAGSTTPTLATAPSAAPAPAPSAPAAAPTAPTTPAAAASVDGHPPTCEVEVFGTMTTPKDAPKGKLVVYVAQDDCMSDKAQMLGHIPAASGGSFVIEVFPKWGTDVTICGALEKPDGTSEYYAKAVNKDGGKFHAEATGEVTFNDVKLDLKKGAPRKFAREPAK